MAKAPKPLTDVGGGKFEPLKSDSDGGLGAYKTATDKRLADIETLSKAILFVAIISLVGVVVAVAGLVIDQVHFNNQTYTQAVSDSRTELRLLEDELNTLKGQVDEQKVSQKTN